MSKYYYITYINKRLGKQFFDCDVIDEHPFEWLNRSQMESSSKRILVNWREISEDEFHTYNEIGSTKIDKDLKPQSDILQIITKDHSEGLKG